MGSVEALARWLVERPAGDWGGTKVMQIRLDEDSNQKLAYLASRFGMPKATLAQELLRASIKDVLRETPGNRVVTAEMEADTFGDLQEGERVHDFSIVHDEEAEVS